MNSQKIEENLPPNGFRRHFDDLMKINCDEKINGGLLVNNDVSANDEHGNDDDHKCCIHDGCDLASKENFLPVEKNKTKNISPNSSVEKLISKLENCKFLAENLLIKQQITVNANCCDEIERKTDLNLNKPKNNDQKIISNDKFDEIHQKIDDFTLVPETKCLGTCEKVDDDESNEIELIQYKDETQMPDIMRLITRDLSEPYSIYTYRYFIHNWPHLCFLAQSADDKYVGAIVCKLSLHARGTRRGYIAMLAVDEQYRRQKIGTRLVTQAIEAMIQQGCDEVVLETEVTNKSAMKLYENLGFARDKRLFRYYLNGVDAFRLKLWLKPPQLVQYL